MARLLLVLALAVPAALPATAQAATCTFDAPAGRVSVLASGVGEVATVRRGTDGAILLDGAPCGAATVANTDDVHLTGAAGAQRLVVDLGGGPLAPGRSAETTGTPEIELHASGGSGDGLAVLGTAATDVLRFGTAGVALNGDGDADVDVAGLEYLAADGGAGVDQLLADGGGGTGGVPTVPLRLAGGTENDVLQGGSAADTLAGDAGNDRLNGGDGDDELTGGTGADDVRGELGDDLLPQPPARDERDFLIGGDGVDHISYAARSARVEVALDAAANDGDDAGSSEGDNASAERVTGGSGDDALIGNVGVNVLLGGPGTDSLSGGGGDDRLDGGAGPDQMLGEGGRDVIDYSGRTAPLAVTLDAVADDGQTGEGDRASAEDVLGGTGADKLVGDAEDNALDGGAGNDVLDGGLGADVLTGGSGSDTADYGTRTAAVAVRIDGTANDGATGATPENDNVMPSVENVQGGSANDWLRGSPGANRLRGGAGDDRLGADAGADVLEGQAGRDTADYGGRITPVRIAIDGLADDGAPGEGDRVALDVEVARGGGGDDHLSGSSANNELLGGGGADLLDTSDGGADVLRGGTGTDTATYARRPATEALRVTIDGVANDGVAGVGRDNVTLDVENLEGHDGRDELRGNGEANRLRGGPGADRLFGLAGDDLLDGGDGDDFLEDLAGIGRLLGGPGDDTFAAADGDNADTLDGGEGTDGGQWDAGDVLTAVP